MLSRVIEFKRQLFSQLTSTIGGIKPNMGGMVPGMAGEMGPSRRQVRTGASRVAARSRARVTTAPLVEDEREREEVTPSRRITKAPGRRDRSRRTQRT